MQEVLPMEMPDQPALVDRVREFLHTGVRVLPDVERVEGILRDLCSGLSQRQVASRWAVSRNTIRAVVAVCEQSGRMVGTKARLADDMMDIARLACENLREKLEDDAVADKVLPIVMGVAVDKALLLTGQATAITETRKAVSREDVIRYLDGLPNARKE
jgi:hypothetical protein